MRHRKPLLQYLSRMSRVSLSAHIRRISLSWFSYGTGAQAEPSAAFSTSLIETIRV